MTNLMSGLLLVVLATGSSPASLEHALQLLGGTEEEWALHWMEKELANTLTRYMTVEEGDHLVLRAESEMSASAFWRMLRISPLEEGKISWRWKIEKSLPENTNERKIAGDDYAARLFLFFGPKLFSVRTRAISYAWASTEAIGSRYKNPYSGRVSTLVIESGDQLVGEWVTEERDFVADYERIFGESPKILFAVALLVDSDNTGGTATAWFDDIVLDVGRPIAKSLAEGP